MPPPLPASLGYRLFSPPRQGLVSDRYRGECLFGGAAGRNRTCDLMITNQALYQLSYSSVFRQSFLTAARGRQTRAYAGRVRMMTSTPSATVPGGTGGRSAIRTASAGISVSCPVTTS
jgi:hypothetical protein